MRRLWADLTRTADEFEPRGRPLAAGRTLLALASGCLLALSPDQALFPRTAGVTDGPVCDGIGRLSMWCLAESGGVNLLVCRVIALVVLTLVALGYRPRWTCVPHWYVTYSLSVTMALPDAGEQVIRILTLLLIPICLADDRRWQWRRPARPLPAAWRGRAYAAQLFVRVLGVTIYAEASLSKLAVPAWRDGTAGYYWLVHQHYGSALAVQPPLGTVLHDRIGVSVVTWGALAVELTLALCLFGSGRVRRTGWALAVSMHGAIALLMGFTTFAMTMAGLWAIVCAGAGRPRATEARTGLDSPAAYPKPGTALGERSQDREQPDSGQF
ncbi:sporulation-delaying protein SdpB family protein [Amycolatopsis suaedae]|uniref:sporulation-delaying protein SdpB family protein n=1 Tax=Amycolatopsis suaedae TaxID=2510978 RepID=UPI0013EF051E|nr:sporulation-delaying protein SdpB family protein [Amycolatopsis suaedae]